MKKICILLLLICVSASLSAEVDWDYSSFDGFVQSWGAEREFSSNKAALRAEYETAARDILPFFDGMPSDPEVYLGFSYDLDENGDKEFGARIVYSSNGFIITFSRMHLEKDGLHARACLMNDGDDLVNDIMLGFDNFIFKKDETFVTGACNNLADWNNVYFDDTGYQFNLLDARLEKRNGVWIVTSDDFQYDIAASDDSDDEWCTIKVGSASFDWDGNLLSYTPGKVKQSVTVSGLECLVTGATWHEDEIILEGQATYPAMNLTVNSKAMHLNLEDEFLSFDEPDSAFTFEVNGFKFKGKGARAYKDDEYWYDETMCLEVYAAELIYAGNTTAVGKILISDISDEPVVKSMHTFPVAVKKPVFGPFDYISDLRFNEDGLQGVLNGGFPQPFEGGVNYGLVNLTPAGVELESWRDYYGISSSMHFGSFWFSTEYTSQDESGFTLNNTTIGFPENCVVSNLSLYAALIVKYDGSAYLSGSGYPFNGPGQFCGMVFSPDGMTFTSNSLGFSGTVYLPSTLPGMLSDKRMDINLELNKDGSIKSFDSSFKGTYQLNIPECDAIISFNGASLTVDQHVTKTELSPGTARLVLYQPQFFAAGTAQVSKLLKDAVAKGTIALNMDGTLSYKMPDMTNWEPLTIRVEN